MRRAALAALVLLVAVAAHAQTTSGGSIRGFVRDSTGGILPGVTVNAKSPAAPGTRSTTTDAAGYYRLMEVPPGEYALTFELQGFSKVVREGIVVRVGRYGTYVEDDAGRRANVDPELPPDALTLAVAQELLDKPASAEREIGTHPQTGRMIVAKEGRYGPYVTEVLGEGESASAKPRTGSLFASMSVETVTLDQALALLSLPRAVGVAADGQEITAQNGRYGPYLKKGADSRSLSSEEQIFEITLDQAEQIYAQPKAAGRGSAGSGPLRELGADPATGKPVVVKEGRFGPYVTDGTTNATLRRIDTVAEMTLERAAELLAEKRAKGPTPRKGGRGSSRKTRKG